MVMEATIIKMNAEYIFIIIILMNVGKKINENNHRQHKDESAHALMSAVQIKINLPN
jgi:hypothetical protein